MVTYEDATVTVGVRAPPSDAPSTFVEIIQDFSYQGLQFWNCRTDCYGKTTAVGKRSVIRDGQAGHYFRLHQSPRLARSRGKKSAFRCYCGARLSCVASTAAHLYPSGNKN